MNFFFVRDSRRQYRFFSSEPLGPLPAKFSKPRVAWEAAKKKVTHLNPRTLLQEQAFERAARTGPAPLRILHGGEAEDKAVRTKYLHFLRRQKGRHVMVLAGEALVLPISALAAFLPGPNVLFYALAIVMILQGQALRGINRLHGRELEFLPEPLLAEWEAAVEARDEARFPEILDRMAKAHGVSAIRKILWK